MKKTILAIAIVTASAGAMATQCGGGYCGNPGIPSTSSVSASISGGVGVGPGTAGGSAIMSSGTTAGTYTVSGAKAAGAEICNNGVVGAASGSAALGYTGSYAVGHVSGAAGGYNSASSNFAASTSAGQSAEAGDLSAGANTTAAVNGGSGAVVTGTGAAVSGGITAAGSLAGSAGATTDVGYYNKQNTEYVWIVPVKGHTTKGETETSNVMLGSVSGSGSLAGSYATGDANSAAGVDSNTTGAASVDVATPYTSASGSVDSGASSMAESGWGGNGAAGSGAFAGSAGEMSAYNTRSEEYDWKLSWGKVKEYNHSSSEYSNVTGKDVKIVGADKFEVGNGNADMAAGTNIQLNGTAGNVQEQAQ